jgi:hypothetical protein
MLQVIAAMIPPVLPWSSFAIRAALVVKPQKKLRRLRQDSTPPEQVIFSVRRSVT